jgi:hypothetical protein
MKRLARLLTPVLLTTLFTGVTTVFLLPVAAQKRAPEQAGQAAQEKTRVYVTDSQSWESIGGWGLSGQRNADGSGSVGGGGYTAGGARPQTAEIIKSFNQRCPQVTITNNVQKADFAVLLDHEGGKGYLQHRNKIAVFNRDGDAIFSDSTRELGNSVKDACQAIFSSASKHQQAASVTPRAEAAAKSQPEATANAGTQAQASTNVEVGVASTPNGADIELDGSFVGSTPSTIGVLGGDHVISVKKNGYKPWERKIKTSTGRVTIAADLEADDKREQRMEAAAPAQTITELAPVRETVGAAPAETIGTLSLTSSPYGAEIYSDSLFVGKTPTTLRLRPGHHKILVLMKDYKDWSRDITAEAGAKLDLAAALEKSSN